MRLRTYFLSLPPTFNSTFLLNGARHSAFSLLSSSVAASGSISSRVSHRSPSIRAWWYAHSLLLLTLRARLCACLVPVICYPSFFAATAADREWTEGGTGYFGFWGSIKGARVSPSAAVATWCFACDRYFMARAARGARHAAPRTRMPRCCGVDARDLFTLPSRRLTWTLLSANYHCVRRGVTAWRRLAFGMAYLIAPFRCASHSSAFWSALFSWCAWRASNKGWRQAGVLVDGVPVALPHQNMLGLHFFANACILNSM